MDIPLGLNMSAEEGSTKGGKKKAKQVRQGWTTEETEALIAIWAEPDIAEAIEKKQQLPVNHRVGLSLKS